MKTQTFYRSNPYSFFHNEQISICQEAAFALAKIPDMRQQIARVTVAVKNPKKKNFRKVVAKYCAVEIGGKEFVTTINQGRFLENMGILEEQAFWMKCEIA